MPEANKYMIIFFERDKLFFYFNAPVAIEELALSAEIIKDLGIVNEEKFAQTLKLYLSKKKLSNVEVIIVLSANVYYDYNITANNSKEIQQQVKDFYHLVPFDSIRVKEFRFNQNRKVLAVNKNLYKPLIKTLENLGLIIKAVIPAEAMNFLTQTPDFNIESFQSLLKIIPQLIQYSFLRKSSMEMESNESMPTDQNTSKISNENKRLIYLLLSFAFLVIILVIVSIYQFLLAK